jgi:hypothetical protein
MSDTQQYWASAHRRFSGEWPVMTFYERFEQVVALILANAALLAVGGVYWVLRERDESRLELTSEAYLTRNRRREEPS